MIWYQSYRQIKYRIHNKWYNSLNVLFIFLFSYFTKNNNLRTKIKKSKAPEILCADHHTDRCLVLKMITLVLKYKSKTNQYKSESRFLQKKQLYSYKICSASLQDFHAGRHLEMKNARIFCVFVFNVTMIWAIKYLASRAGMQMKMLYRQLFNPTASCI
jgi:NAD-specific glutamate dehydrogenase